MNPDDAEIIKTVLNSASTGWLDFIIPYLIAGGSVNLKGDGGDTPLHYAAYGWQSRMVEILVIAGVDPNAQNDAGDTALHEVVRSDKAPFDGVHLSKYERGFARKETFRTLLRRRTNPSLLNSKGAAPLHLAAYNGDAEATESLLRHTPVDLLSSKGVTALAFAVLNNHIECAQQFLHCGASLEVVLPTGHTVREFIQNAESEAVRSLI